LYERYSYYQVHTYLALPSALTSMKLCHCGVPQGFTVFPWMQRFVDAQEVVTRDDLRQAVKDAWAALPEEVILHGYDHLEEVHRGIVQRKGDNRETHGT
jgi:hypothetical protein